MISIIEMLIDRSGMKNLLDKSQTVKLQNFPFNLHHIQMSFILTDRTEMKPNH